MTTDGRPGSRNRQWERSGFRARRVSSDSDSSKSGSPDRSCHESDTCESNPGGSDEDVPDYDVDWENYRRTVTKIFFRDEDYIKRYNLSYQFMNICAGLI